MSKKIDVVTVVCSRVHDGDSLFVKDAAAGLGYWIRLRAIDAPEVYAPGFSVDQPFGDAAAQQVRELVKGKTLHVQVVNRDKYGRRVANALMENGQDLCAHIVQQGWAWTTGKVYRKEQAEARQARRGLWELEKPLPPAAWRMRFRNKIQRTAFDPNMWADEPLENV